MANTYHHSGHAYCQRQSQVKLQDSKICFSQLINVANIDKLCGFRGASLNDVHRTVRVRSAHHSTTSRFFQQRMISQRDALFPLPVCGVAEQVHWGGQTDRQTDREYEECEVGQLTLTGPGQLVWPCCQACLNRKPL